MNIEGPDQDLQRAGDAIGRFADDEDRFRALFDAFRAADGESFRRLLAERQVADRCRLVCEWVRSKECVLACLELAGAPPEGEVPEPRAWADVVERITGDEELVERLADAVAGRDRDGFAALVSQLGIAPFAHLLCHWACTIRGRLICRVVCAPGPVPAVHLVDELVRAGHAIARLRADESAFAEAAEAAAAGDCGGMKGAVAQAGVGVGCKLVCEWFCTWRCLRLCVLACRPVPVPVPGVGDPLSEAFAFADATARLAAQPLGLARLDAAAGAGDATELGAAVAELGLERFCIQLCHWICSRHCTRLCTCVCPDPTLDPLWWLVGDVNIDSDIDATGRTNAAGTWGGAGFAFYHDLRLGGFCPSTSPAFAGVAMSYRFLYDLGSGPVPITSSAPVEAGRYVPWPQKVGTVAGAVLVPTVQTVRIAGAGGTGAPAPLPGPVPTPGSPWVPPPVAVVSPDANGWVAVDPEAIGGGFFTLLGFATTGVVPGGVPTPDTGAGQAPTQGGGTTLAMTFQATRTATVAAVDGGAAPDYSNGLASIRINNWSEVTDLWFVEYATGCCTPIDRTLGIEFTADHEEMDAGSWSVEITGCGLVPSGLSDPDVLTPTGSSLGVTVDPPRGGWGTIPVDTSTWVNCSYTVTLSTRPGLTTGLVTRSQRDNPLTFAICGH